MSKSRRAIGLKFCTRSTFKDIMTHAKFHFNRLMLTLIFGIRASEPSPPAWRTTEKAGPDRVKFPTNLSPTSDVIIFCFSIFVRMLFEVFPLIFLKPKKILTKTVKSSHLGLNAIQKKVRKFHVMCTLRLG